MLVSVELLQLNRHQSISQIIRSNIKFDHDIKCNIAVGR